MDSNHFVHLHSPKFGIQPGEATDPAEESVYGKALAEYLQARLSERGFAVPCVVREDWGWWVTIAELPFTCGICVYGLPLGNGDALDLCLTLSASKGRRWSWKRFRFIDTTADLERLGLALTSILADDPDIEVLGETDRFPLG